MDPATQSSTTPSMQASPSFPQDRPTGASGQQQKKQLLQKLMGNLLNKPGRSMHEVINGVKDAMSAYKNYSKEWDNLSGMGQPEGQSSSIPSTNGGGAPRGIRKVLHGIQQKKATQPQQQAPVPPSPQVAPPAMDMSQGQLIAGQPQTSEFNRPAPVSNLGVFGF